MRWHDEARRSFIEIMPSSFVRILAPNLNKPGNILRSSAQGNCGCNVPIESGCSGLLPGKEQLNHFEKEVLCSQTFLTNQTSSFYLEKNLRQSHLHLVAGTVLVGKSVWRNPVQECIQKPFTETNFRFLDLLSPLSHFPLPPPLPLHGWVVRGRGKGVREREGGKVGQLEALPQMGIAQSGRRDAMSRQNPIVHKSPKSVSTQPKEEGQA